MAQAGAKPAGPRGGRDLSARCVVWHEPAAAPPSELVEALRSRGLTVEPATSSYQALSLVLAGAGPRDGGRPLLGRGPATILLAVEPERLHGSRDMLDVLDRYAPAVTRWCYRASSNPRLGALTVRETPDAEQEPAPKPPPHAQTNGPPAVIGRIGSARPAVVVEARPGAEPAPRPLILRGDTGRAPTRADADDRANDPGPGPVLGPAAAGPAQNGHAPRVPIVTNDELRMLLGEQDESGPPRRVRDQDE